MRNEATANNYLHDTAAALLAEKARWASVLAAPSKPARPRATVRKTSLILRVLRAFR